MSGGAVNNGFTVEQNYNVELMVDNKGVLEKATYVVHDNGMVHKNGSVNLNGINKEDLDFNVIDPKIENEFSSELEIQSRTKVKRTVGLVGGVSMIVGCMIGSGIFASTSPVFLRTKSVGLSLVIWTVSGLVAVGASLCYAELGTMIPKSGGEFPYLQESYGDLAAFLMTFTNVLVLKPAQMAAISLATGDYLAEPIVSLRNNPDTKHLVSKLIAAFSLGLIVFVNCISVRLALRVQVFFTAAKLAALAMLIITGLVHIGKGNVEHFKDAFNGSSTEIADIGFAFYGGLWAYDGWNNLNFLTDELKDPFKTLPLAIMIGIPIVTGFYVMANVAYSAILTSVEIANSKAVAVLIANRMYGVMAWIMPILVACSTFGSANGTAFGCGRLIYVSAREGHMPEILSMVHTKRHTPIPALTFTCIIGWIMLAPDSSNFVTIINYFNFAAWIFYGMTISTVLWMRWKKPDLKRPYKVFIGIPILCLLVSIYLVIAPFWRSPWQSFGCLCFILMGIPIYFAFVKYKVCPKPILRGFHAFTKMLMHKLNLSVPEADDVDAS